MKIITIALEGHDNSGKSTIVEKLAKKYGFEIIKFPNKKYESGIILYEILDGKRSFEPYSFQALQIVNRLETFAQMENGKTYILDRGKMSGIVYALADNLPEEWVRRTADFIPNPDITFVIVGKSYKQDSDIYSDVEYQEKVKELYMVEGKKTAGEVFYISNEKPVESVFSEIVGILERCSL